MEKNKVLIIDDDKDLCSLLKRELEKESYEITICNDGQMGLRIFQTDAFQLVVLDIMLPSINGFDVLTQIRNTSNVPVLMLTAKDSEADKVSGLRLGADDYLTKPFLIHEFVARVSSLIRRYTVFNTKPDEEDDLTFDGLTINAAYRTVYVDNKEIHLTAKEFELLYYLAVHHEKVFTKEQIYTHVWNNEYAFDDSNIMSFISKLRKKIYNKRLGTDYIQTIHGIGYRFHMEG